MNYNLTHSCRNAGRPFQGIDTSPCRCSHLLISYRRNAGRPFQGIATRHGSCSCRSECDWKKCTSPHSGHIKTVHPWRSRARLFIPFPYNRSIPSPHVQNMKSPSARIKSSTETPTNTDEHQHTSTYPDRTLLL